MARAVVLATRRLRRLQLIYTPGEATSALHAARTALTALRDARDSQAIRRHWTEVIDRLEKAWKKLRQESARSPAAQKRVDAVEALRRKDQLLAYVAQARHADQHTIQVSAGLAFEIVAHIPAGTELTIDLKRGTASAQGGTVPVEVFKPRPVLSPIKNRGVSFSPPLEHLGHAIEGGPIVAAEAAVGFYEALLLELRDSLESPLPP